MHICPFLDDFWSFPVHFRSISGPFPATSGLKKCPRISSWHMGGKQCKDIGKYREGRGKCNSENALTFSIRFSPILNDLIWELTDFKNSHHFQLESIEQSKIPCGRGSNERSEVGDFGGKKGVFAPPAPPWGGWRVNSPSFLI